MRNSGFFYHDGTSYIEPVPHVLASTTSIETPTCKQVPYQYKDTQLLASATSIFNIDT